MSLTNLSFKIDALEFFQNNIFFHLQIFMALFIVTALAHNNDETILGDLADDYVNNPENIQQFFKLKKIKKLLFG